MTLFLIYLHLVMGTYKNVALIFGSLMEYLYSKEFQPEKLNTVNLYI